MERSPSTQHAEEDRESRVANLSLPATGSTDPPLVAPQPRRVGRLIPNQLNWPRHRELAKNQTKTFDLREDGQQPSRSGNTAMTRNDDQQLGTVQRPGEVFIFGIGRQYSFRTQQTPAVSFLSSSSKPSSSSDRSAQSSSSRQLPTPAPFLAYFDTIEDLAESAIPRIEPEPYLQLPEINHTSSFSTSISPEYSSWASSPIIQHPARNGQEHVTETVEAYDGHRYVPGLQPASSSASHLNLPLLSDQGTYYSRDQNSPPLFSSSSSYSASNSSYYEGNPYALASTLASGSSNHLGEQATNHFYAQQRGDFSSSPSTYSPNYEPPLGEQRTNYYHLNQCTTLPQSSSALGSNNYLLTRNEQETYHYQGNQFPPSSSSSSSVLSSYYSNAHQSTAYRASSAASGSSYMAPPGERQIYYDQDPQYSHFPSSSSAPFMSEYAPLGQQGEAPPIPMINNSSLAGALFDFNGGIPAGINLSEEHFYDNGEEQGQKLGHDRYSANEEADLDGYADDDEEDGDSGYVERYDEYPTEQQPYSDNNIYADGGQEGSSHLGRYEVAPMGGSGMY